MIGFELRRTSVVVVGGLSLVVGAALLVSFPQGFAGRWLQLAVAVRLLLVFLFPVALAGGAALGRREARAGVGELFASTPRPRSHRLLVTAAALAIGLVAAYGLLFAVGAVWVVPSAGYFPLAALAVAGVGALALVAGGWLGLAAGRAVPRFVTAPVVAVLGIFLVGMLPEWVQVGRARPRALLLSPVFSGAIDDFATVAPRVSAVQAGWLATLAATGLLLATASRRAILPAVVPAVVGAALAVQLLPLGGYAAVAVADPRAVDLVCDDRGPQVCVTRVHAALLPGVAGPVRAALAVLAAGVPGAPTRAVESRGPGGPPHAADTLEFPAPPIGPTGHADLRDGTFPDLVLGAAWEQHCDPSPADAFAGRRVAVSWLRSDPGPERRRLLAEARSAVLACDPDAFAGLLP
ncbi:hypothetical protein ACQP00_16945 [Dactylosporangium sp. CS-047395]|uniref:hypothetical protein n=1 Tax=Dactylosporangium sp. CS-047395 TaxID=3239936 RepID=UPI003D8A2920